MGNRCARLDHSRRRSESRGSQNVEENIEQSKVHWSHLADVEEKIEQSKPHWSHLAEFGNNEELVAAEVDNRELFQTLQSHPTWGNFFRTFGYDTGTWLRSGELEVGEKFAEGGQAELFHAHITWKDPKGNEEDKRNGIEWVLKVFKKSTLLRHLQSQWPLGMFLYHVEKLELDRLGKLQGIRYSSHIECGTLLEDGRFAFLMVKEQEDLRSLIDSAMLSIMEDRGPFVRKKAEKLMYRVATGMEWLHNLNIVHRDLKASNILYTNDEVGWDCCIADFECSIGVVGTGFFRAPEILQACKDKNIRLELFTKEVDVYSYGMTCYEILTGKFPFEGHLVYDFDIVLKERRRPEVPQYVDDWVCELLNRCWQEDPTLRPSFREIVTILLSNSAAIRDNERKVQKEDDRILKQWEEEKLRRG